MSDGTSTYNEKEKVTKPEEAWFGDGMPLKKRKMPEVKIVRREPYSPTMIGPTMFPTDYPLKAVTLPKYSPWMS